MALLSPVRYASKRSTPSAIVSRPYQSSADVSLGNCLILNNNWLTKYDSVSLGKHSACRPAGYVPAVTRIPATRDLINQTGGENEHFWQYRVGNCWHRKGRRSLSHNLGRSPARDKTGRRTDDNGGAQPDGRARANGRINSGATPLN